MPNHHVKVDFGEIHLHLHPSHGLDLGPSILAALKSLQGAIQQMALDITNLQAAVAAETTVEQSAITLIQGLAAKIQALIDASGNTVDPAALQELVNSMTKSQADLGAAVAANTPASPTP